MGAQVRGVALAATMLLATACGGSEDPAAQADNPAGVIISNVDDDSRYRGAEPAAPYQMPDVTLTTTGGDAFNLLNDAQHPVTLVFFGYTHCPDVCPLVMSDLTYAYLHLPDDVREQTQLVFITTDPARDDPATLQAYLDRYDEAFLGLTGELPDITAAAEGMGVAVEGKHRLPGGGYDVGHGAQVVGFRGSSAPVIWTQGTPPADMISDITELAAS
ncbi:MAG TPA: SCO family protein [Nocardioidaceae bacterium]|nr:SCO family protein [Nocardioidaceae bacterium]